MMSYVLKAIPASIVIVWLAYTFDAFIQQTLTTIIGALS